MLTISTEVHDEEHEKKEDDTSNMMSEIVPKQASEHDFRPNWPGYGDQTIVQPELGPFQISSSRDITPHGSTPQVGGRWHGTEWTH